MPSNFLGSTFFRDIFLHRLSHIAVNNQMLSIVKINTEFSHHKLSMHKFEMFMFEAAFFLILEKITSWIMASKITTFLRNVVSISDTLLRNAHSLNITEALFFPLDHFSLKYIYFLLGNYYTSIQSYV